MKIESSVEQSSSRDQILSTSPSIISSALSRCPSFLNTSLPSNGASRPLRAVAVITPSGAAPIPINISISESGSAAFSAAAMSPSPISTGEIPISFRFLIKSLCLGLSITTTCISDGLLPNASEAPSML